MFKITILLLSLFFHSSSVLCQESLHILTLRRDDSTNTAPLQTLGVSVDEEKLSEVSHNILMAESWLRTHVLSYYPSRNINYIVVANDLLCNGGGIRNTVDSMKNLHHSLTRWGLEREIKVSVSFSSNCLHQSHLKPVFGFLEKINSTYTINPTQFSDEIVGLLISEMKSMNDLGVFRLETANVMLPSLREAKSTSRKLSFFDNLWWDGAQPSPVVQFSPAPAAGAFPPEIQSPLMAPAGNPSHPYNHPYRLPPCNPSPHRYHAAPPVVSHGPHGGGSMAAPPVFSHGGGSMAAPPVVGSGGVAMAAPPTVGGEEKLWCVSKPSVPSEKLQVALDYACGAGGADCGPIRPNGSCFSPDSVVAHASYAFNSYWQKNKKNGGVCGFEGTAMLISSDPSFLHCHFILG
ncbi:hypothetical protein L1987_46956 [Smallanthus sonchifolius]|uniref:Uncharacterized protein n=1 Tax=Smallanthus sonchifolius TaxID=185202 RepID=A0ACB9G276_9ASTR|nr:hypothetical protein L1987_46956 [Smallanthus sonchifolius]